MADDKIKLWVPPGTFLSSSEVQVLHLQSVQKAEKKDEVVGSSGKTSSRYMMGAAFHHKFQIQFNLVFQNICETDLVRKLGKFPMSGIEPETNKPENSRPVC